MKSSTWKCFLFLILVVPPFLWAEKSDSTQNWVFRSSSRGTQIFSVPEKASYLWEVVDPTDRSFEFSIAERDQNKNWIPLASNRNLRGGLDDVLELALEPGKTYLFAILLPDGLKTPVRVQMKKTQFSALRDALENTLSVGSVGDSVLLPRWSGVLGVTTSAVDAVWADPDQVFLAFASPEGRSLQVWSTKTRTRLGSALQTQGVLKDFALGIDATTGSPVVVWAEQGAATLQTREWNTLDWVNVTTPNVGPPFALVQMDRQLKLVATGDEGLTILSWKEGAWDSDSRTSGPSVGTRFAATGWKNKIAVLSPQNSASPNNHLWLFDQFWTDAEMPQVSGPMEGEVCGGNTVLWALLGDSGVPWSLYQDSPVWGWQVLPLPIHPQTCTIFSDGPGLRLLGRGPGFLSLYRWDGQQWNRGLDLRPLVPKGDFLVKFLSPPAGAKQGLLLFCLPEKDQTVVKIFELP
jgi:hypothetical protein